MEHKKTFYGTKMFDGTKNVWWNKNVFWVASLFSLPDWTAERTESILNNVRQVTINWFPKITWAAEQSINMRRVILCSSTLGLFDNQVTATRLALFRNCRFKIFWTDSYQVNHKSVQPWSHFDTGLACSSPSYKIEVPKWPLNQFRRLDHFELGNRS